MFGVDTREIPWIAKLLMNVYAGGLCLSLLYFNTMYIREHGFMEWVFFGEVVASLKATVWPYYLVRALTDTEPAHSLSDTREGLHEVDIPKLYPELLEYLDSHGTLSVKWITQTSEQESLLVSRGPAGEVRVETDYVVADGPVGVARTRLVSATLVDYDADGEVDYARFEDEDGPSERSAAHNDETSQYVWDLAMTVTFLFGEPFK